MNVPLMDSPQPARGKISDPDILTRSRYEKEFGLFDSVFHEVSNAIVIISRNGQGQPPIIKDVNHHFELITGYQLDEVRNQTLYNFLAEAQAKSHQNIIEKALNSNQTAILFCHWITKKGQPIDIDMTLRPFNSEDGGTHFICVLRENRPEANKRDKAAREVKRNLLSAMHHNFRTPLNGILGYSEVIMSEMLGPIGQKSYKEYAEDIHGAGKDLLNLIDNLLDLKELETAEFELHEEKFTIDDMISECLKKTANDADKNQISLSSTFAPDLPRIFGDKSRLQQVIHSLLSNAMKFTSPGGRISLSAHCEEDGACLINCEDNGAGMPPQQLAKVFCDDTHLSDIYSNPTVGIGFGLSYVKQMIEKHDGTVSIISSEGAGTTVTLYLPPERLC